MPTCDMVLQRTENRHADLKRVALPQAQRRSTHLEDEHVRHGTGLLFKVVQQLPLCDVLGEAADEDFVRLPAPRNG